MVIEILKKFDNLSVSWVRNKVSETVQHIKESRIKRPTSSMNQSAISRKNYAVKSRMGTRRSYNNLGIEKTVSTNRVSFF